MNDRDESIEDMLTQNPLMLFSIYTDSQYRSLKTVGEKLRPNWKQSANGIEISGESFQEHYSLFWLWVLGAYEVVRTMNQHKECFSEAKRHEIECMDIQLRKLRVPFAKQELAKVTTPRPKKVTDFYAENSVSGHDPEKGCLYVVGDTQYWSVEFIESVLKFLDSFTQEDILRGMDQPPEGQSN